ncbi:MAG: PAS domain S-box protein [Anaerolineae bacterium]|nr:PAS domain S-box protein [Anaerolineae bacterium]
MPPKSPLYHIERLWGSLTRPSPELTNREERELANILSSVELALLLAAMIIFPLWIVGNPVFTALSWLVPALGVLLVAAYILGRGRSYRLGAYTLLIAVYFTIVSVMLAAPGPMPERMTALDFLVTAILLGSLILSLPQLTLLFAVSVLGVAAFFGVPEARPVVTFSVLVLVTVTSALILLTTKLRRSHLQRLIESERPYYALFEQSHDGVFLLNLQGVHIKVNSRAAEMLGYTQDEIVGLSFRDTVAPSEHEGSENVLERLLAGERVPIYERTFRKKDGTPIPVEISVALVRNSAGQPLHIQSVVRDLTERRRQEAALLESEAQLKSIMESMQEMVWSASLPEFRFRYMNPHTEQILGRPPAAFYENTRLWFDTVHPEDREAAADAGRALLQDGQCEIDYRIVRPDGAARWLHSRTWLVRDGSGAPVRADGLATDITERKLAQEQAFALAIEKERVRVLIQFVQSASHELRTPLSTIATSVYLLTRVAEPDQRAVYIAQVQIQIARLSRLIDKLLVMTELDSGTPLTLTALDVNRLVQRCMDGVQRIAAQKEMALVFSPAPELPRVVADWDWLEQAIENVIDNAVRFTPEGGSVSVTTCAGDGRVVIDVRDSGPGIPDTDLPHIFERFWRADEAHSTPGFGLGLPIAQEVIRRHGGRIEIETSPGQGSVFRIVLPTGT